MKPAPDQLVGELLDRKPGWLPAALGAVAMHRTRRWSDVVRQLTPIVNDPNLDRTARTPRGSRWVSRHLLRMFARRACRTSRTPRDRSRSPRGRHVRQGVVAAGAGRGRRSRERAGRAVRRHPDNTAAEHALTDTEHRYRSDDHPADQAAQPGIPRPSRPRPTSSTRMPVAQGPSALRRSGGRAGRVHRPGRGQVPGGPAT